MTDAMRVVVELSEIPRTTLTLDEYHNEATAVIERALAERDAEVARLREALKRIEGDDYIHIMSGTANFECLQRIARAALKETPDGK